MLSEKKVILVTGASSGLGAACADALAARGHRVYGTSRRAAASSSSAAPGAPVLLPMDVTDDASVAKAIEVLLEREGRLDVVVNNAGIGLAGSIEDTEVEEARALFETNFFGVHRVCRHVLPILRGQGGGLLVNIGSIAGVVTIPFQGLYSASKYALEALSDALRMECAAFGVRVVLIEPGDFQTGFTGSRAFAAASGGGSVYRERCERAVATMAHDERNGAQPEQLAALLERVVEGRARGSRYLCGKLADRAIGRLAPWLPARLVDRGLLAYYG